MIDLSIVIPVYNNSMYIRKCLESVADFPTKNTEIIIIDDGSTDGSGEICDEWVKNRSNTVLIHESNKGVSVARNMGIEKASGRYILFLDGDDWVDKESVIAALNIAIERNLDILIDGFYYDTTDSEEKRSFFTFSEYIFEKHERISLLKNCLVLSDFANRKAGTNVGVPWAKLYSTSFIKHNDIFFVPGLKRMQDSVFNMNSFMLAERIQCVDKVFYHYRISRTSTIHRFSSDFEKTMEMIMDEIKKVLLRYHLMESCRETYLAEGIFLLKETIRLQIILDVTKGFLEKKKDLRRVVKIPFVEEIIDASQLRILGVTDAVFICLLRAHLYGLIIKIMEHRMRKREKGMYE